MYSSVSLLLGAVLGYYAFSCYNGLQTSITAARRTGLPYVVVRKLYRQSTSGSLLYVH